jgi:hypothetical protein
MTKKFLRTILNEYPDLSKDQAKILAHQYKESITKKPGNLTTEKEKVVKPKHKK